MTSEPTQIAHRGYAGVAPENTIPAFRAVGDGRHPADLVELDVIFSADEELIVIHDRHLGGRDKRTGSLTDKSGVIWETPAEEITQARVLGSDATVPTLEEVPEVLPPSVGINVELRNPGSFDVRFGQALEPDEIESQRTLWDPYVEAVVETLEPYDHDIMFSSFFEPAIAAARDFAPDIPIGVNVHDSIEEGLTVMGRYDCEAVHPRLNMIRDTPYYEASHGSVKNPDFSDLDLLEEAHAVDADVNVWTVNTWRHAATMAEAGVDGLIADYPDLLTGWREDADRERLAESSQRSS